MFSQQSIDDANIIPELDSAASILREDNFNEEIHFSRMFGTLFIQSSGVAPQAPFTEIKRTKQPLASGELQTLVMDEKSGYFKFPSDDDFRPRTQEGWHSIESKKAITNRLTAIEGLLTLSSIPPPLIALIIQDYYLLPREYVLLHQDNPKKVAEFCLWLLSKPYPTGVACLFGSYLPYQLEKEFPLLLKLYYSNCRDKPKTAGMIDDLLLREDLAPIKLINAVKIKLLLAEEEPRVPKDKRKSNQVKALELMRITTDLNLVGTSFYKMDLSGIDLCCANLSLCGLGRTNLNDASLRGCLLYSTFFALTSLMNTDLAFSLMHFCTMSPTGYSDTPSFIGADFRFTKLYLVLADNSENYFYAYIKRVPQGLLKSRLKNYIPLVEYFRNYEKTHTRWFVSTAPVSEKECVYTLWLMGAKTLEEFLRRRDQIPAELLKSKGPHSFSNAIEEVVAQFRMCIPKPQEEVITSAGLAITSLTLR